MKNHIAVTIGIPSFDKWDANFGLSLASLTAGINRGNNSGFTLDAYICNTRGSNICKNRTEIVKAALESKHDYVLFLDSDMTFPVHTLHALLLHDKDVVGANYVKRKDGPYDANSCGMDKKMIVTKPDSTGLVKADFVGTGIMLIKTSVFPEMSKPWFGIQYIEAKDDFGSDDVFFCRKAREAGFDIWVDQDLSKEIGHVGQKIYTHF
jgi:hypothetical protein